MSERLPVASTRMNLRALDLKLKGIQKGLSLLKCKSDAIQIQIREMQKEYDLANKRIEIKFHNAFKILSSISYYGSDVNLFISKCMESNPVLECNIDGLYGNKVTNFRLIRKEFHEDVLWRAGSIMKHTKYAFDDLLEELVDLASLKNNLESVKVQLEITNKRKNSVEHHTIPRLEATVAYISGELDEIEREEFFRLKKIQKLGKND